MYIFVTRISSNYLYVNYKIPRVGIVYGPVYFLLLQKMVKTLHDNASEGNRFDGSRVRMKHLQLMNVYNLNCNLQLFCMFLNGENFMMYAIHILVPRLICQLVTSNRYGGFEKISCDMAGSYGGIYYTN